MDNMKEYAVGIILSNLVMSQVITHDEVAEHFKLLNRADYSDLSLLMVESKIALNNYLAENAYTRRDCYLIGMPDTRLFTKDDLLWFNLDKN